MKQLFVREMIEFIEIYLGYKPNEDELILEFYKMGLDDFAVEIMKQPRMASKAS